MIIILIAFLIAMSILCYIQGRNLKSQKEKVKIYKNVNENLIESNHRYCIENSTYKDDECKLQEQLLKSKDETRDWSCKFQAMHNTFEILQNAVMYGCFNNMNEGSRILAVKLNKPYVEYRIETVRINVTNKKVMVGLVPSNVNKGTIKYFSLDKIKLK